MIYGVYSVPRPGEESVCRSTKKYKFTDVGLYHVHSTSLLPNIPFEDESKQPYECDSSIFINDAETLPIIQPTIMQQNYFTARYIGRAPLEWYDEGRYTLPGRQFVLTCRNGNTAKEYRIFGTEDAIRGYNKDANENVEIPGGGED